MRVTVTSLRGITQEQYQDILLVCTKYGDSCSNVRVTISPVQAQASFHHVIVLIVSSISSPRTEKNRAGCHLWRSSFAVPVPCSHISGTMSSTRATWKRCQGLKVSKEDPSLSRQRKNQSKPAEKNRGKNKIDEKSKREKNTRFGTALRSA